MSATTYLGRVAGELAESLAYLNSPAAIEGEIRRLENAIAAGDRSPATLVLLNDWRTVRDAQARLVGNARQQTLDLAGASGGGR